MSYIYILSGKYISYLTKSPSSIFLNFQKQLSRMDILTSRVAPNKAVAGLFCKRLIIYCNNHNILEVMKLDKFGCIEKVANETK